MIELDAELREELTELFGSLEAGLLWLKSPNAVLSGKTPGEYLRQGRADAVRRLLQMVKTGQPT